MVSICRGAMFVMPTEKAMPSRMPQTVADQNATRMMTAGGAPQPTKQIQQGPSFCPSCGKSHRLGTVCSKSLEDAFALLEKGVVTSANKRGNPYHDTSTGRFAASPTAGGAGSGGGGGGASPAAPQAAAPQSSPDIGSAQTVQAKAPQASAGGGNQTIAGKVNAQPSNPHDISTGEMRAFEAENAQRDKDIEALVGRVNQQPEQESGPRRQFSHEGAENAYKQAKQDAIGRGVSEDEAHQAGVQAGAHAYRNAVRGLNGDAPSTSIAQSPPSRSAQQAMPGMGPNGTIPSGPPTGPNGTQLSGPPTGMQQAPTAKPAGPQASSPGPGSSPSPIPGGKGKGPTTNKPGFFDDLAKPWAGSAGAMGAGVFTPGGTAAPTGHALGQSTHSLLTHKFDEQQKPAAVQRQQQLQSAQNQSGFMQHQQNNYMNRLRNFMNRGSASPGVGGRRP